MMYFDSLSHANTARLKHPNMISIGDSWSIERWLCKMMEELGELAQAVVKEKGQEALEEEWADCRIILDLIGSKLGFDARTKEQITACKFNEKSIERKVDIRLVERED